ncbi:hypothetical protein ANANG_G00314120 [Anguilla anguilla]|uniref:MANSC domain-containing protein n=1 Tax=Anguilla anguilla TaxID=7936 RepID=A0A9D3LKW0_ANGAN|nr:hypothetical protein ANANG_G00314120 [Anguilla anguilla]
MPRAAIGPLAAALLLMLRSVAMAPPAEQCLSKLHVNTIVNVRVALSAKGTVMDSCITPTQQACIRSCCSKDLVPGFKCNMVVYQLNKPLGSDNCYLFHCDREEDCPLVAMEGVNSYYIFTGLDPYNPSNTMLASPVTSALALAPATHRDAGHDASRRCRRTDGSWRLGRSHRSTGDPIHPSTHTKIHDHHNTSHLHNSHLHHHHHHHHHSSSSGCPSPPGHACPRSRQAKRSHQKAEQAQEPRRQAGSARRETASGRHGDRETNRHSRAAGYNRHKTNRGRRGTDRDDHGTHYTYRYINRDCRKARHINRQTDHEGGGYEEAEPHAEAGRRPSQGSDPQTHRCSQTLNHHHHRHHRREAGDPGPRHDNNSGGEPRPRKWRRPPPSRGGDPSTRSELGPGARGGRGPQGALKTSLAAAVVVGLAFLTLAVTLLGRKALESFNRRHYTRLELNDLQYDV